MTARVLLIDPVGEKGGAEVVLEAIARGLDRDRFTPAVVCLKPGDFVRELRAAGVRTLTAPPHRMRSLHTVLAVATRLAATVQRNRIDLLHANGPNTLLYAGLAGALARRPVVWHVHDPLEPHDPHTRRLRLTQRWFRPAWTVFTTPEVEESYLRVYPRIDRFSRILPGVDAEAAVAGADAARGRRTLALEPAVPLIAMFARMQPHKGHHDLVAAAGTVLDRYPEARFVVCGGTIAGFSPEYEGTVRALIRERGLEQRFILTGYVPEATKKDILAAADIVVHPALGEPFGLAVLEGMAAGKPVVAADAAGPSMTVQDGVTGLLVPRGDPPALARALLSLLDDPARARAMGEAGRRHVRERYSVDAMVRAIEDVYVRVLRETRIGAPGAGRARG